MRAVKKITAFLLAMVMVLSLVPSAFAAEDDLFDVSFDNQAPKVGDEITVKLTMNKSLSGMSAALYLSFLYDKTFLTCTGVNFSGTELSYVIRENNEGEYKSWVDITEDSWGDTTVSDKLEALPVGYYIELTFKVAETASGENLKFKLTCQTCDQDWEMPVDMETITVLR